MNDNDSHIDKFQAKKEPPKRAHCYICGEPLKSGFRDENDEDTWIAPQGLAFRDCGNYGSAIHDRLIDHKCYNIVICDKCLQKNWDRGRLTKITPKFTFKQTEDIQAIFFLLKDKLGEYKRFTKYSTTNFKELTEMYIDLEPTQKAIVEGMLGTKKEKLRQLRINKKDLDLAIIGIGAEIDFLERFFHLRGVDNAKNELANDKPPGT